jgi:hypothetical protein
MDNRIEVGDWVEPHSRDLDPREVARIEGDKVWLYILTDKQMGPFPLDNYVLAHKGQVMPTHLSADDLGGA